MPTRCAPRVRARHGVREVPLGRPPDGQAVTSLDQGRPLTHRGSPIRLVGVVGTVHGVQWLTATQTPRLAMCKDRYTKMKSWFSPDAGLALSAACCASRKRKLTYSRSERWITASAYHAGSHWFMTQSAGLPHPARAAVDAEDTAMVRFW